LEKRREDSAPAAFLNPPRATQWGKYFDLFAVSSQFSGKLVGESELAYSTLGLSTLPEQQPIMTRLGLKGSWGKVGYGISYRAFGSGFVSMSGANVEHPRDEKQLWAEYDFGLFRFRGAGGETWEKHSATHHLTLTRTAGGSLNLAKPDWNASLSSSYSEIGQEESLSRKTLAFTNGVALAYRPVGYLTLEPNLGFKQEWDPITGLKTDTPSAAFALACTPSQNFQLTARTSYAKGVSDDPLKDASTVNTAASLNWKIGKSFLGEQSLSFHLDYRNELRPNLPANSQENLTGMIQFKIGGF
jgi:hypothetical protein